MKTNLLATGSVHLLAVLVCTPCAAQGIADTPTEQQASQNRRRDTASELGDIIVTASKRAKTLQDTPISVSVTSSAAIERSQVRDLSGLQTLVPSLRIEQLQGAAAANFFIRGFGNGANNIGIEPSVGVFVDGVYRSRSAASVGNLPDLQRVEVLRGPQSTLFGKNASAGIISIVTAEPEFKFGGHMDASYGNYDSKLLKGSITGPLSESVAASLAGYYDKRDGYTHNLYLGTRGNDRNRYGVRGQVLLKDSSDLKLRLIADYEKIDEVCCSESNVIAGPIMGIVNLLGGQAINNQPTSDNFFANYDSVNKIENYGISLQADIPVSDTLSFVSISSYRKSKSFFDYDTDATSADLVSASAKRSNVRTLTQEFRLSSNFDGKLNFLLGGFYFNESVRASETVLLGQAFQGYANYVTGGAYSGLEPTIRALNPGLAAGAFGAPGQGRFNHYGLKDHAYSIFGQLDFKITDKLTATGGLNYTMDHKRARQNSFSTDTFSSVDLVATGVAAGVPAAVANNPAYNPFLAFQPLQFLPPPLNYPNVVENGRTNDNKLTYTARLAYKFNNRLSAYATYATGFKASSFNLTPESRPFASDFIPGSPAQFPPPAPSPIRDAGLAVNNLTTGTRYAGPENSKVYEIGLKGNFGSVNVNLAIFDQIIKGFQSNVFFGTGFVLSNAEKESTKGVELDATVTPLKNLTLTSSFTYLDAKYDRFTSGALLDPTTFTFSLADVSGQRLERTPKYTVTVGGTYTAKINSHLDATFHADYYYASPAILVLGLPYKSHPESLNGSVSLAFDNGAALSIWSRNLTQKRYNTFLFPTVAQPGNLSGYTNAPRTYGISASYRF